MAATRLRKRDRMRWLQHANLTKRNTLQSQYVEGRVDPFHVRPMMDNGLGNSIFLPDKSLRHYTFGRAAFETRGRMGEYGRRQQEQHRTHHQAQYPPPSTTHRHEESRSSEPHETQISQPQYQQKELRPLLSTPRDGKWAWITHLSCPTNVYGIGD